MACIISPRCDRAKIPACIEDDREEKKTQKKHAEATINNEKRCVRVALVKEVLCI